MRGVPRRWRVNTQPRPLRSFSKRGRTLTARIKCCTYLEGHLLCSSVFGRHAVLRHTTCCFVVPKIGYKILPPQKYPCIASVERDFWHLLADLLHANYVGGVRERLVAALYFCWSLPCITRLCFSRSLGMVLHTLHVRLHSNCFVGLVWSCRGHKSLCFRVLGRLSHTFCLPWICMH